MLNHYNPGVDRMTALHSRNLGPLIGRQRVGVGRVLCKRCGTQFWLAHDVGKAKLVETRPAQLFCRTILGAHIGVVCPQTQITLQCQCACV